MNDLALYCSQTTLVNSSDGGKLGVQLRNQRYASKRQVTRGIEDDICDEQEAKEVIEVLKSMVVNSANMEDFKQKLRSTLTYRGNMLKEPELNLREYFPYFWVSRELVNTDY